MSDRSDRRSQAERKAVTRALIENAAVLVVARLGFEGLTIDAVSRSSGMSRGATSFHFMHREDLVKPVVEHSIAALGKDVEQAFSQATGVGPTKIRAGLSALLSARFRDDPAVRAWPEVLRRAARDEATQTLVLGSLKVVELSLGTAVADAAQSAGLTLRFDPPQIGALLLALCESTLERKSLGKESITDADQRAFATIGIAMTTS